MRDAGAASLLPDVWLRRRPLSQSSEEFFRRLHDLNGTGSFGRIPASDCPAKRRRNDAAGSRGRRPDVSADQQQQRGATGRTAGPACHRPGP
jgi:hypothetical protein